MRRPSGDLSVVTDSDLGLSSFTVAVLVPVSSRDEPGDRIGLSHLLEHLVMSVPGAAGERPFCDWVSEVGGQANAMTTKESVLYWARTPPATGLACVARLARAVAAPEITDELCAAERRVVLQELLSAAADPEDVATERFYATLFAGHPLARPVGGTAASFPEPSAAEVLAWHHANLDAVSPVVSLVGPRALLDDAVDVLAASGLARTVTGVRRPRDPAPPPRPRPDRIDLTQDYVHLAAGGLGVSRADPLWGAYEVLTAMVGGIPGSLLYDRLRNDLGAVYQLVSVHSTLSDTGAWRVSVGTTPEESVAVRSVIRRTLADVAARRVPPAAFTSAVDQCLGANLLDNEDPVERAYLNAREGLDGESPVERDEKALRRTESGQVAEAAARVLASYTVVGS
ncbi:M16 family metallopeptidase [Actinophytocola xinjiangensis]|uniref:M16 family metallopeptidase n=1 Tax=Actinophytocola xinjiangensis TaxID=485602 RepID=UPI001FED091C|nr:insulinase family protein [Actinophytocola xinjiangensis]